MKFRWLLLSSIKALLLLIVIAPQAFSASWQITYPKPASAEDTSSEYPLDVLSLALDQTGVNYQLIPSKKYFTQGKNLTKLKDNREINVVWSMTDIQREKDLLPIRLPIYKGLVGWRLFIIREDMKERFKYINQLDHLLKLIPIQGSDWPDTKILQANGFDVATTVNSNALFSMVSNAQGDFFPRSMLEIWAELDNVRSEHKLSIQPTLGVQYPAAMYFFVNNKSRPLAHLIKTGFEKAIQNGAFDDLFSSTYQSYIDKTDINKRNFYKLKNTFLPPETPLSRKELWFQSGNTNRDK